MKDWKNPNIDEVKLSSTECTGGHDNNRPHGGNKYSCSPEPSFTPDLTEDEPSYS